MMPLTFISQLLIQAQPGVLLRSEKIFAVMAVLLVIFAGIIFYLIRTGRQVAQLESRLDQLTGPDETGSA